MSKIIFILYGIAVVLLGIAQIDYFFYVAFFFAAMECIQNYSKTHSDYQLLKLLLYSIITPSNYIVVCVLLGISLLKVKKIHVMKHKFFFFLALLYVFFNILINEFMVTNFVFSIIYWAPVIMCAAYINGLLISSEEKDRLVLFLKKTMFVQGLGIVATFVFRHDEVMRMIDFDWVTGSFGIYQGNVFLFYCVFCFIVFLQEYIDRKNNKCLIVLSLFFIVLTGSISLIIIFSVTLGITFFSPNDVRKKNIIRGFCLILFLVFVFLVVTPDWIKTFLVTLYEIDDKSIYITKLNDYAFVFFNDKNSISFELFGLGLGNYSSRAALTCTGVYVDSFKGIFETSMSEMTYKNLYLNLQYIYDYHLGTLNTPFSEYISVKGELGGIGLCFLLWYFFQLIKDNANLSRIFILFLVGSCFLESYLEFGKIITLLYLLIVVARAWSGENYKEKIITSS